MAEFDEPDAGSRPRRRVLLVEDEALVALMIEDMIVELGDEVVATAGTLEEAVRVAETVEADVAVLDVNLAGQPTYAVARALMGRGIPFIFATGYGASHIDEAFEAVPTLPKPFQGADLERAIALAMVEVSQP